MTDSPETPIADVMTSGVLFYSTVYSLQNILYNSVLYRNTEDQVLACWLHEYATFTLVGPAGK